MTDRARRRDDETAHMLLAVLARIRAHESGRWPLEVPMTPVERALREGGVR